MTTKIVQMPGSEAGIYKFKTTFALGSPGL
jgi:hypothetical protein